MKTKFQNQAVGTSAKNRLLACCVTSLAISLATAARVDAELLVYEPFAYPKGPLNGQGGALGTSGTWATTEAGFAQGWWVYPEGETSGTITSTNLPNVFDGTVANLPTKGGFTGTAGPVERGQEPGTRANGNNIDGAIALAPGVTASFQSGTTTWFSYVGGHADNLNQGAPQFMLASDPTTAGSRGLSLRNAGNGIGASGGPPRFNLNEVYPQYFSGGVKHQSPGGYLDGTFGGHNGIVTGFCATNTCNGSLVEVGQPRQYSMGWQVSNARGFGAPNIVIGKIEWDADEDGEDVISVVRFLETDEITEAAFDAQIAAMPMLSSRNWTDNKPDLDQSEFTLINLSSLKFFIDEIRIGTTFESLVTPVLDPVETFGLTIREAMPPATGYDLEWESRPNKLYNLLTNTDLDVSISEWDLIAGDIEATPPFNAYNVAFADARRFFAIEEFPAPPPPPILAADFEADPGGFTVVTAFGDSWEWGAPASSGDGGVVAAGNNGSDNAWGTKIGNPGFYANPTQTTLRSPLIDLREVFDAELTFAEALDLNPNDTARVFLVDANTNDDIGEAIYTAMDTQISEANWAAVAPINLSAGVGLEVRLEWRFSGQAPNADYMGWYIDDVVVLEIIED